MADRRRSSAPRGWRHFLYAFGPWAIGAAIVLFSILVVAYENRYRTAVRHEIEGRLLYNQETTAREAAGRLRDYLGDVVSKIQIMARLIGDSSPEAVPWDVLETIARHDKGRNYCLAIYTVGINYAIAPSTQRMLFYEQLISRGDQANTSAGSLSNERGEVLEHLHQYEMSHDAKWLMSCTVAMDVGRRGQVVTAPIRGRDGALRGLVAALVPTAMEIARVEKSLPEGSPKLWLLTAEGDLLGERVAPAPTLTELGPIIARDTLATAESESRVLTAVPVMLDDATPWTLVATQPRVAFYNHVRDQVGGPWTRRLLITVACGNFLGLIVLLTLRHWREQITVLRAQAEHDPLTGAYSRRFLDREAAMLCRRIERVGLLMVDLNDFKRHNDTLGHQVGDKLLKATVETLMSATRENDFVVRMGGDEFLVLLPLADDRLVTSVEARVRWAVEQWNLSKEIEGAHLSLAIGTAAGLSRHLDYLVKQSDERMYVDKQRHKEAGHPPAAAYAAAQLPS